MVAVVLAAGAGRRIGGCKALLRLGRHSFLTEATRRLTEGGVAHLVVVLGHEAERVARALPEGVEYVVNPRPDEGMLGSVLLGLAAAERAQATAVLLHPVDHPLVEPAVVASILCELRQGARIVVPSLGGRRGHPGGFAREAWPALRRVSPAQGARALLASHADWVVHVDGGPGCLAGIDARSDYERLVGPWPASPWIDQDARS